MRIENKKLIFEREQCFGCHGKGQIIERVECPNSGQVMRGRVPGGKCPHCGATRKHEHRYLDTGRMITCPSCDGTGDKAETRYSFMNLDIVAEILEVVPMFVIEGFRREISMNESLLGIGLIAGITDYQDWTVANPKMLIERVRTRLLKDITQACNYCDEDGNLCKSIGISPHTSGWSARPIYKEADELAPFLEIGEGAGILRGNLIAGMGGNGTTAIYRRDI